MILRTVLVGVLAAVAMFIWNWLAHGVLPLGMTGIDTIQNEQVVQDTLRANIDKDGMYMFPFALTQGQTDAKGPEGLLVYHQNVRELSPMMLGSEFLLEVVEMVILAFLISWTTLTGFAARLGFAALAGFMVAITTNGSLNIWFGFPADYVAAEILTTTVGFVIGGAVIALMLPRSMKATG
ncbi:MAG: hypothetical protein ACT4OG_10020 [Alphaproteobacteria bacterium]